MGAVLVGARCLLAVVFLVAAAGKARDRAGARAALTAFDVPPRLAGPGAILLPVVETVAAIALVPAPTAVAGAVLGVVLLGLFSVAIGRQLAAGRAPECQCFGQLQSEPIGPASLVRNVVLIALAVLVVAGGGGPSLTVALSGLNAAQVGLVVVSVLLAASLVLAWWLGGERRRLGAQLDAVAQAHVTPGLEPGERAPEFALAALTPGPTSLGELLGAGLPVALVFVSDQCGPCLALMPSLRDWQQTLGERLTLATLFGGDLEAARHLAREHGLPAAMSQGEDEVFREYRLRATPTAVLIDAAGAIAAPPAEGGPAIEALIRSAVGRSGRPKLLVHHA
jgi:thiol-disulfide isomerase/thioredoxin